MLKDKLESRIKKTLSCWFWTGFINKGGYGRFSLYTKGETKTYQAHRLVWEIYRGKIAQGLQLDHLCRNRHCVRPNHLEAVSKKENIMRGVGATANNAKKTTCPKGHKYTHKVKSGFRRCRICDNRKQNERRAKQALEKIRGPEGPRKS